MRFVVVDCRDALAQLRRSPGFSVLAVTLLAVGLGASTAIFSLAYGIVFQPLPFHQPEALVGFQAINARKGITQEGHSVADFRDYAERSTSFVSLAAYRPNFAAYHTPGEPPVQLVSGLVTENFFRALGVSPRLGRVFLPEEFTVAGSREVILSASTWSRHFSANDNAIGRVILIDDQPHTIVGVMKEDFREPDFADIWLPFPREAPEYFARDARFWTVVGRLREDTSLLAAQGEIETIAAELSRAHPETNRDWTSRLAPLHELRTRDLKHALLLLSGAVGLVLTIACFNLANLLLARGINQLPDLAVRLALGATPARLARRLLIESVLLAMLGGLAGCALAALCVHVFVQRLPAGLVPRSHEIALHPPVVAFAFTAALLAGVVFGALPALQILGSDVNAVLKNAGQKAASPFFSGRVQRALVSSQVALSVVMLVCSVLLMKGLLRLQRVDVGFATRDALSLQLSPPSHRYETNLELAQYYERIIDEVARVPGVAACAINASAPFSGISLHFPFWVEGQPKSEIGADEAIYAPVSETFFATLKIPLKQGRLFDSRDNEHGAPVAIINEALARRLFPGESALGKRVLLLPWLSPDYREIIGIVGDTRQSSPAAPPPVQIYVPQRQMPWFFSTLLIRFERPEAVAAVRAALQRIDPTLPFAPTTLEESLAQVTAQPRLYAILFSAFAAIALGLSAFGIFASLRFTTQRRTREIGIRMALGSSPRGIVAMVLAEATLATAWGLGTGIVISLFGTRLLRGLLHGVEPADPWIYAVLIVAIPLTAIAAAAPTAFAAASLPPTRALQHE